MGQKTINKKQGFGLSGEFYDSSIKRVLARKTATDIEFGKVAFLKTDGTGVTATYDSSTAKSVAGIAVNPKEYIATAAVGTADYKAKAGTKVGIASVGRIIVKAANAVKVGDKVYTCVTAGTSTSSAVTNYSVGDLCGGTAAPSTSAGTGGVFVEVATGMFDVVSASANECAVITLG